MNLCYIFIFYCFSIHSIFAISPFIKLYDSINYDVNQHKRVRRSINFNSNTEPSYSIFFQAFHKNFHLKLKEDKNIFNENIKSFISQDMVPVRGKIHNNVFSNVYGTLVDGIFRGVIIEDNRNASQWFIEHSGYYFDKDPGFHSIIYHESHVVYNKSGCGWLDENIGHKMRLLSVNQQRKSNCSNKNRNSIFDQHISRKKRSPNQLKSSQYVCNLYLQADTFLWDKVMSFNHVKHQRQMAFKEISSIFTQHVQGAQTIYQNTVFRKFDGSGNIYNGIGFRVDRVKINTTDDCTLPTINNNPFCDANIDVTNFLNLNSYVQHDDFCLAYIFTYRDFSGGTLGLAWVAEPGGSGGVCEKHRMMQEGAVNVRKSLNTGIVTLLNYGSYVALKVSQLTFAHEMGHNFGSKHDDDHKDHSECLPKINDPKGNYIMFASATSGDKENNNKFSVCSKDSISRLLDRVTNSKSNCFLHQEGSFCGNQLTEEEEQCDCGYSTKDCQDKCCHPKQSNKPCQLKSRVLLEGTSRNVHCSPTAGECCNDDCQFRPSNHLCRTKGECYNAAFCHGNSSVCPASTKVRDLTKCADNTRVCKNGDCVGSICESVKGWHECSITSSEKITPEMMCYVACKENRTDAPCISTFDLEKDQKLHIKYPILMRDLLMSHTAIRLKPGAPCDNYHGYCDAFLRCRSVEADGPLARIKNMIFNSKMLQKLRLWVTQYWWAVMLMCIGSIIFTGIFLKMCSQNTPSVDPKFSNYPKRKRPNAAATGVAPGLQTTSLINGANNNNSHHQHHQHQNRQKQNRQKRHQQQQHRRQQQQHQPLGNGSIGPRATAPPLLARANSSGHGPAPPPPLPPPVRPPRNRPCSMIQTNGVISDSSARPISMNIESSIHIQELHHPVEPNYPPPAYNEVHITLNQSYSSSPLVMLPQHGRGKKGHRIALNHQASRYK